jgi:hypothetical protein
MRGGSFPDTYGYPLAALIAVVGLSAAGYLMSKQPGHRLRVLVGLASAVLVAEVLFAWYASVASAGSDQAVPPRPFEAQLEDTPDIVVVVADAYVGFDGLERYFGVSDPAVRASLTERGFVMPVAAYSPYATTRAALASLLDADYPIVAGPGMNKTTTQVLYDRIGGDNSVVSTLVDNGYHITFLESGWSGSTCGDAVDECVESPFLDESTLLVLHKTWLGRLLLDEFGYSFTQGALATADWLRENLGDLTRDGEPNFVMAHLEIPHPPFHLDSDCDVDTSRERRGVNMQLAGVDLDERKGDYLAQAECVDRILMDIADEVSDDTVLVFLGDHGSDAHHQLAKHPSDWTEDDMRERLNILYAVRLSPGCAVSEPAILPNVFVEIFDCLGDRQSPEPVETRLFRYAGIDFDGQPSPIEELSDVEVGALTSAGGQ